jgi:hypothetical protein
MEVVNQKDLVEAFAARGWRISYDETSQPSAELRLGDRVLVSLLTKRSPNSPFYTAGWITTDALSIAYTVMLHPRKRRAESTPLVSSPYIEINRQVAFDEDIDGACAAWMDWARGVDLDAGIAALLDKDANRSGAMPARHLAALAVTGNVEVLETYRQAFAQGDRLGFVPYIMADHIIAALGFAERRRAEPDWLPRSPKLRV